MKEIVILFSCLFLSFLGRSSTFSDFEYELNQVAGNFRQSVMDKDESERQMRQAGDLADEIQREINTNGKYTDDEISDLKYLKKSADALETYIGSVGGCANTIPTKEEFRIANQLVGGTVYNALKGKFCVDFISVSIDKYTVYLGENNTSEDFTVFYSWKVPDGKNRGNGSMGLSAGGLRHIYDNRENPNQKIISVYGVTCKKL